MVFIEQTAGGIADAMQAGNPINSMNVLNYKFHPSGTSARASLLKQKLRHLLWQRHEESMREVGQAASFCRWCQTLPKSGG
jgi:hypothetical protein